MPRDRAGMIFGSPEMFASFIADGVVIAAEISEVEWTNDELISAAQFILSGAPEDIGSFKECLKCIPTVFKTFDDIANKRLSPKDFRKGAKN